jgi:hypothetical protein
LPNILEALRWNRRTPNQLSSNKNPRLLKRGQTLELPQLQVAPAKLMFDRM